MNNHAPEKFTRYINEYFSLRDRENDYAYGLFGLALNYAPLELIEIVYHENIKHEMLSSATHVDDAGNPVHTYQQVANKLGVPVMEVERYFKSLIKDNPELAHVGKIYRLHKRSNAQRSATRKTAEVV